MADDTDWPAHLPATSQGQVCALCGSLRPRFLHPLDPDQVRCRIYGKGHTLPHFWCLCDRCERLYVRALDDDLVDIVRERQDYRDDQVEECVAQPLALFRRADLGVRQLDR